MYIEDIKRAARISHTASDDDLTRMEEYAIAEMKRLGIPSEVITINNALIRNAVVAYAMSEISPTKAEKYEEAWLYQLDCLRKHDWGADHV